MASPSPGAAVDNPAILSSLDQCRDRTAFDHKPIPFDIRLYILSQVIAISGAEGARMALVSRDTCPSILLQNLRDVTITSNRQAIRFFRTLASWWPFGDHKSSRKAELTPSAGTVGTLSFGDNVAGTFVALALAAIPKLSNVILTPSHLVELDKLNKNATEVLPKDPIKLHIATLSIAYQVMHEVEYLDLKSAKHQMEIANLVLHIANRPNFSWLPAVEKVHIWGEPPFLLSIGQGGALLQFFLDITQLCTGRKPPLVANVDAYETFHKIMARINSHTIPLDEEGSDGGVLVDYKIPIVQGEADPEIILSAPFLCAIFPHLSPTAITIEKYLRDCTEAVQEHQNEEQPNP